MWGWSQADLGSTPVPIPLFGDFKQAIVSGPRSLHPGATLNVVATESTKHGLGLPPTLGRLPPPRVIAHFGVVLVYTSTTSGSEMESMVRRTARVAVAVEFMTVGAMVDCSPGAVAVAMTQLVHFSPGVGLSSGGASA